MLGVDLSNGQDLVTQRISATSPMAPVSGMEAAFT
jgi:hypothetical protein